MSDREKRISENGYHTDGQTVTVERLSDVIASMMMNKIMPQQELFCRASDIFKNLLPAEIYEHCRIDGLYNGQLRVIVDSPTYMYQLQMYSSNILVGLKRQCSKYRIKKIKFAIG
jgi:hypothetical protein